MSSSESKDNKVLDIGKKPHMLRRTGCPFWLQGGPLEEGIDLFPAGSLELGYRTQSESQEQADCVEL